MSVGWSVGWRGSECLWDGGAVSVCGMVRGMEGQ